MALTVYGYRYSVYTRIAKMALATRGLSYQMIETDPFADPPDARLRAVNPFHRVPVLDHDGFVLTETAAITRYLARAFQGAALVPDTAQAAARMDQVIAIADAYGYWPLVRQVFSHAVFRPATGAPSDDALIAEGLAAAKPVLRVLDDIARGGLVLNGREVTLADLHLAPMIGYFVMSDAGRRAFENYAALGAWWDVMQQLAAYQTTDPGLASFAAGE